MSRRQAAEWFGVSTASAIRWAAPRRRTGEVRPKPQGGDKRTHRIEAHAPLIFKALETRRDLTLEGLRAHLAERGVAVAAFTLCRFFKRHAITLKKDGHAAEQDRPDLLSARQAWFDSRLDLDPERLVFIDEPGASIKMARRHGRTARGERLRMSVPHEH